MSVDAFEELLSRQPFKSIPPEWKHDILPSQALKPSMGFGAFSVWLREWLWPSPLAWAGVGALWLVIVCLNLSSGAGGVPSAAPVHVDAKTLAAILEHRCLLAEALTDGPVVSALVNPTPPISPQSHRSHRRKDHAA